MWRQEMLWIACLGTWYGCAQDALPIPDEQMVLPDLGAADLALPTAMPDLRIDLTLRMDLPLESLTADLPLPPSLVICDSGTVPDADPVPPGVYGKDPLCSPERWCWDTPLPQGHSLQAMWGASATDLWAVGLYGTAIHWSGARWWSVATGTRKHLLAIWGSGSKDVFAVGSEETILHFDGTAWSPMKSPPGDAEDYHGVWGSGPNDVWAIGRNGGLPWEASIMHWDGAAWTVAEEYPLTLFHAIWGSGKNDVYVGGEELPQGGMQKRPVLLHWNGTAWTAVKNGPADWAISSLTGSGPGDVWAVASSAWHFDGKTWQRPMAQPFILSPIWARGANDVWARGGASGERAMHFDGKAWSPSAAAFFQGATAFWASSPADAWALGRSGALFHFDGVAWSPAPPRVTSESGFRLIRGTGLNDVWATGWGNLAIHWDGAAWTARPLPVDWVRISGIWGSAPDDYWAVTYAEMIFHWNGTKWCQVLGPPDVALAGVWGSGPNEVWAVGKNPNDKQLPGVILRWNGQRWSIAARLPSGLTAIGGSGAKDVWAVGEAGAVFHWNGIAWTSVPSGVNERLNAVWATAITDAWIVGDRALILHWDGKAWSGQPWREAEPLEGIWASGPKDAWASGFDLLKHWDGARWTYVPYPSYYNVGVWGVDAKNVWLATSDGVLRFRP